MIMETFGTALEELEIAFNRRLKAEQVEYWHRHFGELDEKEWIHIIALAVRECERFPSIATIYNIRNHLPQGSKTSFDWEDKSIFWEEISGILKATVVPRGQGNLKPSPEYFELTKERVQDSKRRLDKLKNKYEMKSPNYSKLFLERDLDLRGIEGELKGQT